MQDLLFDETGLVLLWLLGNLSHRLIPRGNRRGTLVTVVA